MTARKSQAKGAATAFPNKEESLALQASLLDGDAALAAWRQLSAKSIEGGGVAWIAPLLMQNLTRLAPEDPWVKSNPHFLTLCRLKGRGVTVVAEGFLRTLAEAHIDTLALKGLALGASVYEWPGLRTVSDVDILVPTRDLFRAIEALRAKGLNAGANAPKTPEDLRLNHAFPLTGRRGHEPTLDLHWHVLSSSRGDDDDAPFWDKAQPLVVGAAKTRTLGLEDQLLHALVHGVRWTRMPHVRWVADAALILRRSQASFRCELFLEHLERFDAVTPAREGLRFLVELLNEGHEIYERVRSLKRSRFSDRAFKARATAYETRTVADRIALRIETAVWARRARRSRRGPSG